MAGFGSGGVNLNFSVTSIRHRGQGNPSAIG
jgi:hypothetical protein